MGLHIIQTIIFCLQRLQYDSARKEKDCHHKEHPEVQEACILYYSRRFTHIIVFL